MVGILTDFLKRKRVAQILPNLRGKVLDLGCGDSPVLNKLATTETYIGVDFRPDMVKWLQQYYPQFSFYCRDLDREPVNLPYKFDTILMLAVIEHLERPSYILTQLPDLLSPGGQLVLTTPTPLGNQIQHVGSKFGLFSQEAADEHKFIFNKMTMSKLLDESGLSLTHYKRFLLGQNQLFIAQSMIN